MIFLPLYMCVKQGTFLKCVWWTRMWFTGVQFWLYIDVNKLVSYMSILSESVVPSLNLIFHMKIKISFDYTKTYFTAFVAPISILWIKMWWYCLVGCTNVLLSFPLYKIFAMTKCLKGFQHFLRWTSSFGS